MRTQKWMIVLLLLNVGISSVGFTLQLPYLMSQIECYVNSLKRNGGIKTGNRPREAEFQDQSRKAGSKFRKPYDDHDAGF